MKLITPIRTVTDSNFESQVLKSDKPVVVRFTSKNCPPCRRLSSYLKKLRDQYWTRITVLDYPAETDSNSQQLYFKQYVPENFYPVLVFFHKGEMVSRIVGFGPGDYVPLRDNFAKFAAQTLGDHFLLNQEREAEFVEATTAAEAAFKVDIKPAKMRYERDSASYMRAIETVTARANAKLQAGKITEAESEDLIKNKWHQVFRQKNFQAAMARFKSAVELAEKKLLSSLQAAEHEFSLAGTSLKKADLPESVLKAIKELGHHTIESIYSAMLIKPDAYRSLFDGLDYDATSEQLRALIPQETLDRWEHTKTPTYSTGLLPENDE